MGKRACAKAPPAGPKKRARDQSGRREDKAAKVERFLKEYIYGKLDAHTIQTTRVNSQLIREAVEARLDLNDKERPLGKRGRSSHRLRPPRLRAGCSPSTLLLRGSLANPLPTGAPRR